MHRYIYIYIYVVYVYIYICIYIYIYIYIHTLCRTRVCVWRARRLLTTCNYARVSVTEKPWAGPPRGERRRADRRLLESGGGGGLGILYYSI